MGKRQFGELELCIRAALQQKGKASVHDIVEEIGNCSYTTILTVMSRMAAKKELVREKVGKQYIYAINPTPPSHKTLLSRLQDKLFGGKKITFVSYLLENGEDLSSEDLDALEKWIANHRKGRA